MSPTFDRFFYFVFHYYNRAEGGNVRDSGGNGSGTRPAPQKRDRVSARAKRKRRAAGEKSRVARKSKR